MADTLKVGNILRRHTFTVEGAGRARMLKMKAPLGTRFAVPMAQVQTVVLDPHGAGFVNFKVVGAGTTLAELLMPRRMAEQAQAWILERIDGE